MASYVHVDPNAVGLNTLRGDEFGGTAEYAFVASATEEKILFIRNASSTGIRATILELNASLIAATSTAKVELKLYYNPTITASGTSATGVNFLLGSASSVVTYHTSATTTASGTRVPFTLLLDPQNPVACYKLPIVFVEEQSLLLTGEISTLGGTVAIDLRWDEETIA